MEVKYYSRYDVITPPGTFSAYNTYNESNFSLEKYETGEKTEIS